MTSTSSSSSSSSALTEAHASGPQMPLGGDGFEDVLGSGGIFRKILVQTDKARPEFGQEVTVKYSVFLLDHPHQLQVVHDEERSFRIGDAEVMPALELVAKMIRVEEQVEIHCEPRFAYGDKGLKSHNIPANARIKLVLQLLRIDDLRLASELNSHDLLREADKKKHAGNRFFKEQDYDQAAKLYKRALKLLESWEPTDGADNPDDDDKTQCKDLFVAIANNVANVQLKLGQLKEAKASCRDVLQIEPQNVKALYRVGQICLLQSDFEEGLQALRHALAKDPGNASVRDLISRLHQAKHAAKAKEKQLFGNLWRQKSTTKKQQVAVHQDDDDPATEDNKNDSNFVTKRSTRSLVGQTLGFSLLMVFVAWLVWYFTHER